MNANTEDVVIRKLRDDLELFIGELAKVAALSEGESRALRVREQHFSDLLERICDAIVYNHCVFVERRVGTQWQYLLQHGDFMVCDRIPSYMRNAILKPIFQYLTPLGSANEIIWYCMN